MNKTIEKLSNGDFKVSEMDECIVCGVETNEPKDKHIDFRFKLYRRSGSTLW